MYLNRNYPADDCYFFSCDSVIKLLPLSYEEILFIFYLLMLVERITLTTIRIKDDFKENLTSLCHGLLCDIVRFFTCNSKLYLYTLVNSNIAGRFALEEKLWVWLLCLLVVDFTYYWNHRLNHEVHCLWAFHQVHHSSEQYNYMTAVRRSIVEDLYNSIFYIPAAMLFPPKYIMYTVHLIVLYQMFLHTELLDGIQSFEWTFNMPKHHRIHHGCNKFCIDKNYGGILIIWDRIFGTFQTEKPYVKIFYGLKDNPAYFNIFYQQVFGLSRLIKKCVSMKSFGNGIRTILMGPRWRPGTSRLGINLEEKLWIKHRNPAVKHWNISCIYTILFTLTVHHAELYLIKKTDIPRMILAILNIFTSFLACGLLCDGINIVKVIWLETIHWLIVVNIYPLSPLWIFQIYVALWNFYSFYLLIILSTMILLAGLCYQAL